nr:MAG TPA: hypothetical protein [Caudoviricetes sp.]
MASYFPVASLRTAAILLPLNITYAVLTAI